jgi:hypothetical protein
MTDDRPEYDANILHAYADSDSAKCPKTRRSFGGACLRLAGGTIVYKCKFQPTIAGSSTEAEFMAAYDTGKMILYVQSILWDLGIPQEAATVMHENNDACMAMRNAQKLTPRTRHMDIKYFQLCDWVERDLMHLERVDTKINMADMFTKSLPRLMFYRHANYLLGHIPPKYSPIYSSLVGTYSDANMDTATCVPTSYTTPITAVAVRVCAPLLADYAGSLWAVVLWHG